MIAEYYLIMSLYSWYEMKSDKQGEFVSFLMNHI
jgi:hypothetical protein